MNETNDPGSSRPRFQCVKAQVLELMQTLSANQRLPSRPELARRFGVARTTIDRAISELIGEKRLYARDGSGTYVAERPMSAGSSSPDVSHGLVGVIVNRIDDPNIPEIVWAIEEEAQNAGFSVLLGNEQGDPARHTRYVEQFIDAGVKGLILIPGHYNEPDEALNHAVREAAVPFVFGIRNIESIPAPEIIANNYHGGFIAAEHLIHAGYERIAYVSTLVYSSVHERLQGYMSALTRHGREIDEDLIMIRREPQGRRTGYEMALELLDRSERAPDALFCFNDAIAAGSHKAVQSRGMAVGRDVGIVGFDDSGVCQELEVKLTSVRFPKYEIGRELYRTLNRMMNGEAISRDYRRVFMPELIVRESTDRSCRHGSKSDE